MAAAIGWTFIGMAAAAIVLAVAVVLKVFCGVLGLGIRLVWLILVLPALVLAAVVTGPLLLIGVAALFFWAVAALCRR